jgi:hypothetical protein
MLRALDEEGGDWFVKFGINHGGKSPEAIVRESMISLLAQAVDAPVVPAWVIPADGFLHLVPDLHKDAIRDHVALMPYLGETTMEKDMAQAKEVVNRDPPTVADIFAFMHWIGDDDRSLSDVMLVGGKLVLIDNGMCGPGRDSRIRSYHPMPDTNPARLILKCYGGGKKALVEFVLRTAGVSPALLAAPPIINRIEALSRDAIHELVLASNIEPWVAEKLSERKQTLRAEYTTWLEQAVNVCR